jgi:hypothetical protein
VAKIKKLTAKQRAFLDSYLLTRNITRAAREAGYKNPNAAGYEVLNHPLVQEEVKRHEQELRDRFKHLEEKIIRELEGVAFDHEITVTIGDFLNWDADRVWLIPKEKLTTEQLKHIKSIKQDKFGIHLELRQTEKTSALKTLGHFLGLPKKEVSNDGDRPDGDGSGAGEKARSTIFERLHAVAEQAGK